ncbi:MAG TPA: hypothetical protein VHL52_12095 [Acidimicrobiia bacterium]|nr:hypothetical protein [Acidimicrobiia bacterium]
MASHDDSSGGISTIPEDPDPIWNRRETRLHYISFGFVLLITALAATGVLGVRTTTSVGSADGYTLEVHHASVSRPGLATPFSVSVVAEAASLPGSVTVRVDSAFFQMFDENGLDPQPASSFNDSEWTTWTFDVPPNSTELKVDFDARIEPAAQWGETAAATLLIEDEEVVTVDFSTWIMP